MVGFWRGICLFIAWCVSQRLSETISCSLMVCSISSFLTMLCLFPF
ncbi:unnamed protein product [Linum tenue]|uniref:Uncharacterized protein n=1 Tax=Linum tenue TaxID=586396 RepID=A0AAV0M9Z4_9ROSI|nr:unnamed protein product [Linum tenue]